MYKRQVLKILEKHSFVYFTSNKSSILELCEWIGANRTIGNPFEAVSYTHLDVYKRQELEKYAARYPELTIKQPPYTMIEFDDSVALSLIHI